MQDKVLVIACGAIATELVRIRKLNRWNHIDFQCLPPDLHNRPERIAPEVQAKIDSGLDRYRKIFVAYADCGTAGALDKLLAQYDIERIPGAHCYEFFAGSDLFNHVAMTEPGSFYLTDFLTRHFERLVIKGLGIDRFPRLKHVYFNNYKRLVYLAQSDSEELRFMARQHADYLGLAYARYDCGTTTLSNMLKPCLGQAPNHQTAR